MSSKERIDFPPREFSSVEISALMNLAAEVHESIECIGVSLVTLSNASYLNQTTDNVINYMEHETMKARNGIDKIMSIISIEKELIKEDGVNGRKRKRTVRTS